MNLCDRDYGQLFHLFNIERVPLNLNTVELQDDDTFYRFRRSFIGKNPKSIIDKLDKSNVFIADIWKSEDTKYITDVLDRIWRLCQITGAGSGFPTMILYLKASEMYNIWLPFMNDALCALYNNEIIFKPYKYKSKDNLSNYLKYNKYLNDYFRVSNNFKYKIIPQEIDYILYRISIDKLKWLTTG